MEEKLQEILKEFAQFLEDHGADNLTANVDMYAEEFAQRKTPDVMEKITEGVWMLKEEDGFREIATKTEDGWLISYQMGLLGEWGDGGSYRIGNDVLKVLCELNSNFTV